MIKRKALKIVWLAFMLALGAFIGDYFYDNRTKEEKRWDAYMDEARAVHRMALLGH